MRIGEFEITDHGNRFRMEYVGPKRYLTTASPDNHPWIKELLNKLYGRHEFVYKAPPLEFKPVTREWLEKMMRNSYSPDAVLPLSAVRAIIFKNEKETAMDKTMKDYVGCKVLDVKFVPPYTTIFWDDGTVTRVKCADEPYDSEKGFAMAVMKRLFGDCYFKDMKYIIEKYGGYKQDTPLIRIMDDYRGYLDSPIERELAAKNEEIEKLKKELEWVTGMKSDLIAECNRLRQENYKLRRENYSKYDIGITMRAINTQVSEENAKLKKENDRLLTEVNTLDAVRYGIVKTNEELKKENEKLEKMLKEFSDSKEELCIRLALAEDDCVKLKKAKENMAKKLAENKSLMQENERRLVEVNDQLINATLNNGKLRREYDSLYVKNKANESLVASWKNRALKAEAANEQYKDIVNMQKEYDALKVDYDVVNELHTEQCRQIRELQKEIKNLEIRNKQIEQIKEILK